MYLQDMMQATINVLRHSHCRVNCESTTYWEFRASRQLLHMYIQHKRSQVVACATVSYYARQVLLDVKCAMPVSDVTSTQTLKWRQYKQTPFLSIFKATMSTVLCHFYRAMLCIRGTSHWPVSVCLCLSATSRSSTKTAKRRITQTTPQGL